MSLRMTHSRIGIVHLGNRNTLEVHRLPNETQQCQISEILRTGHGVKFVPDTIEEAHKNRYDNCAYCLGGSRR